MALDFFDASINRIAAWSIGIRSWQKAMLMALCTPNATLKSLQDENKLTELLMMQEEIKTMPFGEIWDEYCRRCGKPADGEWFGQIEKYEAEVLSARN